MDFRSLIIIMMSAVLVNNLVLSQFLGICPFLGVSKEIKSASGMGAAVIFVMIIATAVTWPIQRYVLDPNGLGYLQTVVFILVIASLVQLLDIAIKRYLPPLYQSLGVYLPLIVTNCAILGLTISNIRNTYTYIESLTNAIGAGLGFLLAMVLFAGLRTQLESADPPPSFKGLPIVLFTAAILSLSFFGFSGVIENMFG